MVRAVLGKHFVWAIDKHDRVCVSNASRRKWDALRDAPPQPTALAICALGTRVLVGSARGTVTIYDATTCAKVAEGHAAQDSVTALHVAESEGALFVGTAAGSIVRLDLRTLDFVAALDQDGMGHAGAVLSFATVNEFLISGGTDAAIFVWHLETNSGYREISMATAAVTALRFVDRYLWVGEGDGTVRVLDIYGEDDAGIACVVRKRAHTGPVRFLECVGASEIWSAPSVDDGVAQDEGDAIAVWDVRDCILMRREAALPRAGLLALLARERELFERVGLSVVDASLRCTELAVEVEGSGASETPHAYSQELMANMEAEVSRVTGELKFLKAICTCSPDVMKNGSNSLAEAPVSPSDVNMPRRSRANGHGPLSDIFKALGRAETALNVLLTQPKKPCVTCARMGRQGMVDVGGVVRAAEGVAAAVNMVNLLELPSMSRSDVFGGGTAASLAALPYNDEDDDRVSLFRTSSVSRAGSLEVADVTRKDFEVIVQERDVLAQDLQNLQQDSENTVSGLEKLLEVRAKRIRTLEQDLEKASLDAAGYEVTKRRCAELEQLTRQQVQHIEKTVKSFEPRLNEHVEHAYSRMAADRDQLNALQDTKADLESQLGLARAKIAELERENGDQRSYINTLTYDTEQATREIDELRADAEDNAHEISSLRVAVTTHNSELELTRSANTKLRDALNDIKSQMQQSEVHADQSRGSHERVLKLLKEANQRLDRQKAEIDEMRDAEKQRGAVAAEDVEKGEEHAVELEQLKTSLATSQRELAKLTRESISINKSNRVLEIELSELKRELLQRDSIVEKLQSDNHALMADEEARKTQETHAAPGTCVICTGGIQERPPRKRGMLSKCNDAFSVVNSSWQISGTREDKELRDALEAAAESTRCTQEVVKELASTAKAYKKAAAYHAQSQAAIFAILKRMRQLSKRKMVNGAQLGPVVDGLLQVLYLNPSEAKIRDGSSASPNQVSSAERLNGNL